MVKKVVIANWKMNPETTAESRKLFQDVVKVASTLKKINVIVSPPAIFLSDLVRKQNKNVFLCSQDVFWGKTGSFTGQFSASMIRALGVESSIIGHSEKRALGETDEDVSKKVLAVLKESLIPIVCIGEHERDHGGEYLTFLSNQLKASISRVSRKDVSKLIVAYEPIWAIGKTANDAMDSHKLHEVVIFIRKVLTKIFGREYAQKVTIIYGGSVEPKNASDLIKNGNVSGFLVGHASLDSKKFKEILVAVEASK